MTPDPKPTEALKRCDCVFKLTDRDLPPVARTEANLWKAKFFEAWKELSKANKGLRRLQSKLARNTRATDRDAELAAMREAIEAAIGFIDSWYKAKNPSPTWIDAAIYRLRAAIASTAGTELLERLRVAVEERDQARIERDTEQQFRQRSDAKLAAVTAERDSFKRHNQWQAEEIKAHKDGGKSLAERCYDYVDAGDELFSKAQEIMGGRPVDECLQDGFKWMVGTTWTDSYDGSVEVVLTEHAQPMTQEQANAFLALGFGQVYESQGERGVQWTSRGPGKCCPKVTNEDEHRICQLKAHLAAAESESAGLRKELDELQEMLRQIPNT